MKPSLIDIISSNGIPFRVRIVREGDKFGLDNCLTHKGEPMVEFYDARYPHTEYGQFVSRYNLSTFMGRDRWGSDGTCGINLCGHVPDWTVDDTVTNMVRDWIRLLEERKAV